MNLQIKNNEMTFLFFSTFQSPNLNSNCVNVFYCNDLRFSGNIKIKCFLKKQMENFLFFLHK
jgi:hypothetical protein